MFNRLGLDRIGLFQQEEPRNTLFEKTNEFNSIHRVLKDLRIKQAELREAADKKGAGSPDFRKHNVVKLLIDKLDQKIDGFNREGAAAEDLEEKKRILALSREIKTEVDNTLRQENRILSTPRDNRRKYLNDGIEIGTVGTAVASAVFTPLYFATGVIAVAGAKVGNAVGRDITGISNLDPMSLRLVTELSKELEKINDNLGVYIRDNDRNAPQPN